ncbi:MAG: hypothetical protein U1F10_00560 [Burkholderiales bacterium]
MNVPDFSPMLTGSHQHDLARAFSYLNLLSGPLDNPDNMSPVVVDAGYCIDAPAHLLAGGWSSNSAPTPIFTLRGA